MLQLSAVPSAAALRGRISLAAVHRLYGMVRLLHTEPIDVGAQDH